MAHTAYEAIKKEQAIFNGVVIAESGHCQYMEEDSYFPPESIKKEYLKPNGHHEESDWKGLAKFYDVVVGDKVAKDAAWSYTEPLPSMEHIKDYVAFRGDVKVTQWKRGI